MSAVPSTNQPVFPLSQFRTAIDQTDYKKLQTILRARGERWKLVNLRWEKSEIDLCQKISLCAIFYSDLTVCNAIPLDKLKGIFRDQHGATDPNFCVRAATAVEKNRQTHKFEDAWKIFTSPLIRRDAEEFPKQVDRLFYRAVDREDIPFIDFLKKELPDVLTQEKMDSLVGRVQAQWEKLGRVLAHFDKKKP